MKIQHGLLDGQVLQRNRHGRGSARITGQSGSKGAVDLRVTKDGKVPRGRDWAPAGTARDGRFTARLEDLPAGGPYRVELRIRHGRRVVDRCSVDEVFVGDVWVLAGQSNMQGIGNMEHAPRPHPRVRAFYMRDEWGLAEEPLHFLEEAVDVFHNGYGDGPGRPSRGALGKLRRGMVKGVSPGLAFGLDIRRRTRVPQGLIACAHGGSSMQQWSPALGEEGGASLYGALMRRYRKLGQPIAGLLWYQGESDAHPDGVAPYTRRMVELVAATRRDMALPRLPWVVVQLGCHACAEEGEAWNRIQEQQRLLPTSLDLVLDDGIHIGGEGQQVLGRRLARAAHRLVHKARGTKPGIVLDRVTLVPTPPWHGPGALSVELTYRHVVGALQSPGRPTGFALVDRHGRDTHAIYKTTLAGNRALLHTGMPREHFAGLSISYGHGRYPVCTITDADGMSIPGMRIPLMLDGEA